MRIRRPRVRVGRRVAHRLERSVQSHQCGMVLVPPPQKVPRRAPPHADRQPEDARKDPAVAQCFAEHGRRQGTSARVRVKQRGTGGRRISANDHHLWARTIPLQRPHRLLHCRVPRWPVGRPGVHRIRMGSCVHRLRHPSHKPKDIERAGRQLTRPTDEASACLPQDHIAVDNIGGDTRRSRRGPERTPRPRVDPSARRCWRLRGLCAPRRVPRRRRMRCDTCRCNDLPPCRWRRARSCPTDAIIAYAACGRAQHPLPPAVSAQGQTARTHGRPTGGARHIIAHRQRLQAPRAWRRLARL